MRLKNFELKEPEEIRGVVTNFNFEIFYDEYSKEDKVDFMSFNLNDGLSEKTIFIQMFREPILLNKIPMFLDFTKKYFVKLRVFQLGSFLFCHDLDLYDAVFIELIDEKIKDEVIKYD